VTARRQPDSPCSECRQRKPRTREFYYRDKRASDGLHSCCKACHLKRTAANEKARPRDRSKYNAEWDAKNREAVRRRASPAFLKWRKENREKRLAWEANYRRTEIYRKANAAHQENRRARLAGAEGSHTAAEFFDVLIAQAFRCFYCGTDISNGATEDHFVPLSRGGSNFIENIRAACRPCNIKKGNRPADQMIGRR
jgi:5-methylcytosine-specific restriction endonuclease McrA